MGTASSSGTGDGGRCRKENSFTAPTGSDATTSTLPRLSTDSEAPRPDAMDAEEGNTQMTILRNIGNHGSIPYSLELRKQRSPLRLALLLGAFSVLASACGLNVEDATNAEDAANAEEVAESDEALSFVTDPGQTSPFVNDAGSQCWSDSLPGWVHCCPFGHAMVGAHLGNNVFRCAKIQGGLSNFADGHEQRNGMLSCPLGKIMVGYWNGGWWNTDRIVCATPGNAPQWIEFVDDGGTAASQDSGMHVCKKDTTNPGRYAMSGIHRENNRFNCFR